MGLVVVLAVGVIGASCGSRTERIDATHPTTTTTPPTTSTTEPEEDSPAIGAPTSRGGDPKVAAQAVTVFGAELFNAARGQTNAVVSPMSVAIALAMLEPGANGAGKTEIDKALHITDAGAFHASMTALRSSLETAKVGPKQEGFDQGDLQIAIANATYLQRGFGVLPSYIEALGKYYGPTLNVVDFAGHGPDAVRDINKFIADGTRNKITKVLEDIDPATVFALVNALYLKASWLTPFDAAKTKRETFTRLNASTVQTELMHGLSEASTRGDGWVAARKFYSARLAADFVLPDAGNLDTVAAQLGSVFPKLERDTAAGSTLVVPKVTTRFMAELKPAFNALGINAVYGDGYLMGIANARNVVVDQALHATFLAMDEQGTEAAAATVITGTATGAISNPPTPVPVILDRPFFFRIVDTETGATLFIGQVLDPTAG